MKPSALICPLGATGPVITETLNAMIEKHLGRQPPSEPELQWNLNPEELERLKHEFRLDIYVLFTTGGAYWRRGKLASVLPQTNECALSAYLPRHFAIQKDIGKATAKGNVHLMERYKMTTTYELTDGPFYKPIDFLELPHVRLVALPIQRFENGHLGEILEDVRTTTDNRHFEALLFGLQHCVARLYPESCTSLAGGRKTMSAYAMVSAMLFGPTIGFSEDTAKKPLLTHVLVRDPALEKPDVYQLPRGTYDFETVPYFSLSELNKVLIDELDLKIPDNLWLDGREEIFDELFAEKDFLTCLHNPQLRLYLYQVGRIYEENLHSITAGMGRLIRQGIALRAIKHDMADYLPSIGDPRADAVYDAILTFSRYPKGEIKKKPVALNTIVQEALDQYKSLRPRTCLDFLFKGELAMVSGDEVMLRHLFYNLIKNSDEAFGRLLATKPTAGITPAVSLDIKSEQDKIRVLYQDNLGGVPKERIPVLFQLGYSTKGKSSAGFGLFLCRRIMTLHGGSIEYDESQAQNGVCFELIFSKD